MTFDIGLHEVCVRVGVRYVITKFSRMDSLPNFLTHGAPLRARESSAINDLPNASNLLKTFLFADDTSFFNSHKDPNQLIRVNDHELGIIKNI